MASTMSATPVLDPAILGFEKAMREFKAKLKDDALYAEILKTTSIDQVYELAETIQTEQGKTGHLRHLSKIQKYLERMRLYTDAIDTFVSAKPDILALIWGPMKLLIQWTTTLSKGRDAIVNITAEIGDLLPEFQDMTALFSYNTRLNDVMALFFQDILDFYLVTLKFFSMTRWKYFFEALWPKQKEKIDIVKSHIDRHATLMRTEVRLEHIREEHDTRLRALEHFERSERERSRQEFYRIQTDTNPKLYDRKLDEISGRMCEGTGKWLLQDDKFNRWLDVDSVDSKILWLEGIPGAGKTYLAGTSVRQCQGLGKIAIFAFLSNALATTTSALSILHSFIFQLASKSEDLQRALCHSGTQDLKGSLDCAVSTFKSLLDCAGPTYLVLDGLDEIELPERRRLLSELVKLCSECKTARILISSRAESDIERVLGALPRIRVDHHNSRSIQVFVERQSAEWFAQRDFLPHEKREIEALLAPVATKSEGMFLYAKILFSCLDFLSNIREVRLELRVLPKNLNDAYSRILKRINNIPSGIAKSKARRLLGFVGCSPTPLTVYELDQLLTLELCQGGEDVDYSGTFSVNLRPVDLCGPIVEVVDEYVQLVHFTVKEYLFSPDIQGFVDKPDMLLQLTRCCLAYLCQGHHDPGISKDEVKKGTMCGLYRLHSYAEDTWYPLVQQCLGLKEHDDLLETLEEFATKRFGGGSDEEEEDLSSSSSHPEVEHLKEQSPSVYQLLLKAAEFRCRCGSSTFQISDQSWSPIDPLNTSNLSISIHQTLDRLLCGSNAHTHDCCQYLSLTRIYGSRLFKCPQLGCISKRQGFWTRSLQGSHTANHTRPWKCEVAGCEYSETGFLSKRMQEDHFDHFHRDDQSDSPLFHLGTTENNDQEETLSILFDLVRADRGTEVKSLLGHFKALKDDYQMQLLKFAAKSSSASTMSTLFNNWRERNSPRALGVFNTAIQSRNLEAVEWLLRNTNTRLKDQHKFPSYTDVSGYTGSQDHKKLSYKVDAWSSILASVLESDSETIFQTLLPEFVVEFLTERTWTKVLPLARSMSLEVIRATSRQPEREERLLVIWKRIIKGVTSRKLESTLGAGLGYVADSCCSLPLAKALLSYGAPIDYTGDRMGNYRTPLHRALRRGRPETAELARFLLYRDADPDVSALKSSVQQIKDEIGAREMSKWLGMTWDELVAQVKADREAGICPPEYL